MLLDVLRKEKESIDITVYEMLYTWWRSKHFCPQQERKVPYCQIQGSQKFQLMKHQLEVAAVYSRQVALYSSLAARVMAIVMN